MVENEELGSSFWLGGAGYVCGLSIQTALYSQLGRWLVLGAAPFANLKTSRQVMVLSGDAKMGSGHFGHFDQTRRSCSQHHGLAIHVIFGPVFFLIFPRDIFKICFRINAILSLKNAICL